MKKFSYHFIISYIMKFSNLTFFDNWYKMLPKKAYLNWREYLERNLSDLRKCSSIEFLEFKTWRISGISYPWRKDSLELLNSQKNTTHLCIKFQRQSSFFYVLLFWITKKFFFTKFHHYCEKVEIIIILVLERGALMHKSLL